MPVGGSGSHTLQVSCNQGPDWLRELSSLRCCAAAPNWKYPGGHRGQRGAGDCIFVLTPFNEVILLTEVAIRCTAGTRQKCGDRTGSALPKYRGEEAGCGHSQPPRRGSPAFGGWLSWRLPGQSSAGQWLSTSSQTYKKYLSLIQESRSHVTRLERRCTAP